MISFSISAIDIVLTLAVVVLGILYLRKIHEGYPVSLSFDSVKHDVKQQDPYYDFQAILPDSLNDYEELDDSEEELSVFSDSF